VVSFPASCSANPAGDRGTGDRAIGRVIGTASLGNFVVNAGVSQAFARRIFARYRLEKAVNVND